MPSRHSFEHLPLLLRDQGRARLRGGSTPDPQTVANKKVRAAHSASLASAAQNLTSRWSAEEIQRQAQDLPTLPAGKPILLRVDPSLDISVLRDRFAFEIVGEQEEGFVLVASEDINLSEFAKMVQGFSVAIHGSATIASVHKLYDDPNQSDRLRRVLSEHLFDGWAALADHQSLIVDVGIACTGTREIPTVPRRGKRDSDADWARKENTWSKARAEAYDAWDDLSSKRQTELVDFVHSYDGEVFEISHDVQSPAVLPDSFTIRVRISGKGLKDLVLNYPFVFEVVEPDDIALPQYGPSGGAAPLRGPSPLAPLPKAPAVCVIDSGIQEAHQWLAPAIDPNASHCFLPDEAASNVGDFVSPAGHGTRIAGAILYGERVPPVGAPQLPFWIQNARVLDARNRMPETLFPPATTKAAVVRFNDSFRGTKLFNHSINSTGPCRTRHMSAWAAEIDLLCYEKDVLILQSAGNVFCTAVAPIVGIKEHCAAGRVYPAFLSEDACRVANPAQSLQALTVGSIAYGAFESGEWRSFADAPGRPSAFSRSGFGIWDTIKPEVVEFGGDAVRTANVPPDVLVGARLPETCPELVRSTMYPPGPAYARDDAGTSYATPKVTRIAAEVARALPDEPALLYRALVVQSARWPEWADRLLSELREGAGGTQRHQQITAEVLEIIRWIGFGLPDIERAAGNTDYRTTLVTSGRVPIGPRECHVYQVPIPDILRRPGGDFDVRIDVTLSYVAQPRRTRRRLARYLSTWVEWKSSKLGESIDSFRRRVLRESDADQAESDGDVLPWTLHEQDNHGVIRGVRRNSGTVQKDWATVKSNSLPRHFCIAVLGHQGWSRDPDSTAEYCLAVTLDVAGQEVAIYDPLRLAVEELRSEIESIEAEVSVDED